MSVIIDFIILGIILISVLFGYKKGLTKCIIKILTFFIAIIISVVLFKPISNFIINNTTIDDNIKKSIVEIVSDDIIETGKVKEDSNLPKTIINYINDSIETSVNQTKQTIVNSVAEQISTIAVNVIVAIGTFIVARVVLIFVSALSSIITDLPIIKQFDKAGGILYGLIKALIIVFIVFAIISFISPIMKNSELIIAINNSILGSMFYNNNILVNIIF